MEKLKELLANECSFRPSGKLLDELFKTGRKHRAEKE